MSKALWYKNTRVGPGQLKTALDEGKADKAKEIHFETDREFRKNYPQCTNEWFAKMNAPVGSDI